MSSDHFTGFVFGLGATALGIYLYTKNKEQVDDWLRRAGKMRARRVEVAPVRHGRFR